MIDYEGIFDGESIDTRNYKIIEKTQAIVDGYEKELSRTNDPRRKREIYTEILVNENVEELLTKLTSESSFYRDFPEFYVKNKYAENVINCSQNNSYHRFGVLKHILYSVENVGKENKSLNKKQIEILKWVMLLHDIGKPYVKFVTEDGIESFSKHDEKSAELSVSILDRFGFLEEEKKVMLVLIKYHDRFLNEGEIIYDNLKILAEELGNDKENFNMLIEVKDADAKAKSIKVYDTYLTTKEKYVEFANIYFNKIIELKKDKTNELEVQEEKPVELTDIEYYSLIEDVLAKYNIINEYQPIVNIKFMKVIGYEVFSRINSNKNIDIQKFLEYARTAEKEIAVEQALFINAIDSFEKLKYKEANRAFFNLSVESFDKYINKPRIYDAMNRFNLVLDLKNYEKYQVSELQSKVLAINEKKGYVSMDNFGTNYIQIDDFKMLKPNYVKIDKSIIKEVLNDESKQRYIKDLVIVCLSRDIELIAMGVDTKETYQKLVKLGVLNFQGYYISKPTTEIQNISETLESNLNDGTNESII